MTDESWAGWYRDRHGSEAVILTTDGQQLRIRVRGTDFEGESFDALAPVAGVPVPEGQFGLVDGVLDDCVLEWDLPLPVLVSGTVRQATLSCLLSLRRADPDLYLALHLDGAVYESNRAEGDFAAALATVQRILPPGIHLQTCIACAFSDYFPAPVRGLSGGSPASAAPRTPTATRRAGTTSPGSGTGVPGSSRRYGAAGSSSRGRRTAPARATGAPSRSNSPEPAGTCAWGRPASAERPRYRVPGRWVARPRCQETRARAAARPFCQREFTFERSVASG